jgi:two-component system response regulator VicR
VDDDPEILDLIRIILESEGHEVLTLTSGQEAVALVREHAPDVVLLDIVMRARHGMDVLAELRRAVPNVRVVLLSGAVQHVNNMVDIARALGAEDFIEKPFDAQQLLDVVARAG